MKICKNKLFIIITVALLVIGLALFGVFGMNNTVDYSKSYEINVSVDGNVGETSATMKSVSDSYLASKGFNDVDYAFQQTEDGTLIYKFVNDVSSVNVAELEAEITKALNNTLVVTVKAYETVNFNDNQIGWIILACGLAIIASFIYTLFMEKLAGALTVIATSIISAVLFVAMMGITRIPAQPVLPAVILLSALLASVLSMGIVNRCREALKNVGNDKLSYAQVADKCSAQSRLRVIIVTCALALAGIALVALAPVYLKLAGIQLILSAIVSSFTAYAWSGIIWSALKAVKKDRKAKLVEEVNE